jgi:two-component system, response regulator YesN
MTFKMLIVDDEPMICRGLAYTIPWEEHQIEVAGLAHDGEDAMNKVKEQNGVDIVITDIRMPNKDGLDLAAFLKAEYPQTKIIMISGYDEFKYAQKAIQLGVEDYLLKPVNIDELLEVVQKITREIRQRQAERRQHEQIRLRNLIYHHVFDYPTDEIAGNDLLETTPCFAFISMKKQGINTAAVQSEEEKALKVRWKKSIDDSFAEKGAKSVSIFISENLLLTCLVDQSESLIKDWIGKLELDESLVFVLSDHAVPLNGLSQTIGTLREGVRHLPINSERIFFCSELKKADGHNLPYPEQMEESMIQSILRVDQNRIEENVHLLVSYLKSNQFLLEESISICRRMSRGLSSRLKSLSQKDSFHFPSVFEQGVEMLLAESYNVFGGWLLQDIERAIHIFNLKAADNKDWLIERALEYIRTYYKSEIKAQEVADVVNITPNYFSSLFKQKTGKSFNEYVNHMRVEEAKTLLEETPFKVNEIAEQAGFHEYKYFVEVFRRYAGMTPTQYRKLRST